MIISRVTRWVLGALWLIFFCVLVLLMLLTAGYRWLLMKSLRFIPKIADPSRYYDPDDA